MLIAVDRLPEASDLLTDIVKARKRKKRKVLAEGSYDSEATSCLNDVVVVDVAVAVDGEVDYGAVAC